MVISQVIERFIAAKKGRIAKPVVVQWYNFVWVRLILSSPYFIGLYFSLYEILCLLKRFLNTFNVYNGDPYGHNDPRRHIISPSASHIFLLFFFDLLFVHFDTNACPSVFINSSGLARPLLWEPSRLPKLMKSVLEQRPSPVLGVRPCALSRLANG